MNSKNVKQIRSQLRNVTKELLPEVLQQEAIAAIAEDIEKRLRVDFGARLEAINDSIMNQLKAIDERSKDVQQFILNQVAQDMAKQQAQVKLDETPQESTTSQPNQE